MTGREITKCLGSSFQKILNEMKLFEISPNISLRTKRTITVLGLPF